MAKTGENSITHSLFADEQLATLFPLIELKLQSNVYLEALLPKDQIFDDGQDNELAREKEPSKKARITENSEQTKDDTTTNKSDSAVNDSDSVFDNPYLREPKLWSIYSLGYLLSFIVILLILAIIIPSPCK